MKIALLNDTHFGCRNDSPHFINYQNKFYEEQFFPYLIKNNIKCLIHLGDVVDRRKFINHNTAHNFKKVFWDRLKELDIETHVIIGNHDTYYKNTNEVNALENLNVGNEVKIYTKATEITLDGLDVLLIPWICEDNMEDTLYKLDNSTSQIAFGHLEVKGFEMHKGVMNEHGLEKQNFRRFEKVFSGHFHKKSDDGHIFYLGTQYQIMWSDYNCPKGFHIFDTDTRELERIENTLSIFKKLSYDDTKENYDNLDLSSYENCFVKLFVNRKTNPEMYGNLIERFYNNTNIHELIINEDTNDITQTVRVDTIDQGEDTLTFLGNYIEQVDTDLDKHKLKEFAKELYTEASE
jgi:DNA repair exonuclease SbcCD nuclease subunit